MTCAPSRLAASRLSSAYAPILCHETLQRQSLMDISCVPFTSHAVLVSPEVYNAPKPDTSYEYYYEEAYTADYEEIDSSPPPVEAPQDENDDGTPSAEDATPSLEDAPPSPADATPSPADATPSPADATPSPADQTPSPADATPSPADVGTPSPTTRRRVMSKRRWLQQAASQQVERYDYNVVLLCFTSRHLEVTLTRQNSMEPEVLKVCLGACHLQDKAHHILRQGCLHFPLLCGQSV